MKADFSGLMGITAKLDLIDETIQKNQKKAVMRAGMAYQADVQRVAPVDTGQYRTSIRADLQSSNGGPIAVIGSPMPQTRRLEYGYYGVDKLGRRYNQPAKPHWRPTWDLNIVRYELILNLSLAEQS
jgi:hypothetical protein